MHEEENNSVLDGSNSEETLDLPDLRGEGYSEGSKYA
jgi:hypothetical protein